MPNRFEHPEGEATGSAGRGLRATRAGWSAWRCASLASLALAGCVVANVAGCGGGGGGSSVVPTPTLATATILLLNTSGIGVNGTVTLANVTKTTTNSRAEFPNLRAGTYPLVFVVNGVRTSTNITVVGTGVQTFAAVQGQTGVSSNGIRISGRTLLNSPVTSSVSACTTDSLPVTDALAIQVRDLQLPGRPIVASYVRLASTNGNGTYNILSIPRPSTYRVEARSLESSVAPFAGVSASFTISQGQTQRNLDICTNQSLTAPGATPPPPPGTPTPGPGTGIPSATQTALATITQTPGAIATLTAAATLTPAATALPTGTTGATPGTTPGTTPGATTGATTGTTPIVTGVPVSTAQNTPTTVPTATPLNTPGAGTPAATATFTPTPVGVQPTAGVTPPGNPANVRRKR